MHTTRKNTPEASAKNADLVDIEVKGLVVDREFGVLPSEAGRIQRILLDAKIGIEPRMIQIEDTESALTEHGFDIRRLREIMREEGRSSVTLLETLAGAIADRILALDGARTAQVSVRKTRTWADVEEIVMTISKSR